MPCKKLDEIHELIDWTRLEKLLSGVHANQTGEKAWPPLITKQRCYLDIDPSSIGTRISRCARNDNRGRMSASSRNPEGTEGNAIKLSLKAPLPARVSKKPFLEKLALIELFPMRVFKNQSVILKHEAGAVVADQETKG